MRRHEPHTFNHPHFTQQAQFQFKLPNFQSQLDDHPKPFLFFFNWKIIALQNVAVFCHINTKHFNIRILELSQHWKCYGERLSCSVVFISLRPRGLYPARLLCPWNFPGENTRVGSHSLLQGIFPTQGSSPGLPHCRWILYQLNHKGSPYMIYVCVYKFYSFSKYCLFSKNIH